MYTNILFGPIEKSNEPIWCNSTRPKGMQDTDLLFSDSGSKPMHFLLQTLQTVLNIINYKQILKSLYLY